MIVPVKFLEMYSRVVRPSIIKPEKWYPMPAIGVKRDFVFWYFKESMGSMEISEDGRYFKVIFYPFHPTVPNNPMWSKRKFIPAETHNDDAVAYDTVKMCWVYEEDEFDLDI